MSAPARRIGGRALPESDLQAIAESGLFDAAWYRAQHPDAAASGEAPLAHYLRVGEARGWSPHPLFDPGDYRARYPDVAASGLSPLVHYVRYGGAEGRRPHPLFDVDRYRERHPELAVRREDALRHWLAAGAAAADPCLLFDGAWYRARCPAAASADVPALLHWLRHGAEAGVDPHPLFDVQHYREAHPGLAENPLVHYLREGARAGASPHPLFDPHFYRAQGPDLAPDESPLEHYLRVGGRAGRAPHPLFDAIRYLEAHPALRARGEDPLLHWLREGAQAGLDPHPLFSVSWYLARHPEVAARGENPLLHWIREGAAAGYDPHPLFDAAWYRTHHLGALPADGDPLRHYVEVGAAAGLRPHPLFDPWWYQQRYPVRLGRGETPYAHYVRVGRPRGWRPGPLFDLCLRFLRQRDPALRAPGSNPLAGHLAGPLAERACPDAALPVVLPEPAEPEASIVIPVFGSDAWTLACLRSIAAAETRASYEVIAVDDRCGPDAGALEGIPGLRLLRNAENLGFVGTCNRGAAAARGRVLVFLNNDTLVTDGWLDALLETRRYFPQVGVVGAKLVYPDGLLQEAGGIVFSDASAANYGCRGHPRDPRYDHARRVDYVSGAALAVDRELFAALGGFDRAFAPAYYEDTDLCFRVWEAGREVVYQPAAQVVHFGGASYGRDPEEGGKRHQVWNRDAFRRRWAARLARQPAPGSDLDEAAQARTARHALVLDARLPRPEASAAGRRRLELIAALRRLGYGVTLLPADRAVPEREAEALRRAGVRVIGAPWLDVIERHLEAEGWRYDLCLVGDVAEPSRWLEAAALLCPGAVRLFDPVAPAWPGRGEGAGAAAAASGADAAPDEPLAAARRAHGVLVGRADERGWLAEREPGLPVRVLGPVCEAAPTQTPLAARADVVCAVDADDPAQVDALAWLVREAMPLVWAERPALRLRVLADGACEALRELAGERVRLEGTPADARPFYARARVAAAPLRSARGVEGGVERAMAFGVPCVATAAAAAVVAAEPGRDCLVADDPAGFARALLRLAADDALWQAVARAGLERVREAAAPAHAERVLGELRSGSARP